MSSTIGLTLLVVPVVVITVVVYALIRGRKFCPSCENPLPFARKPTSSHQALYGGWTCGKCGAELDRNAAIISRS
jgi:ribosomal protein L37AE/L43A